MNFEISSFVLFKCLVCKFYCISLVMLKLMKPRMMVQSCQVLSLSNMQHDIITTSLSDNTEGEGIFTGIFLRAATGRRGGGWQGRRLGELASDSLDGGIDVPAYGNARCRKPQPKVRWDWHQETGQTAQSVPHGIKHHQLAGSGYLSPQGMYSYRRKKVINQNYQRKNQNCLVI